MHENTEKPIVKLQDWYMSGSPWAAPEVSRSSVSGRVFGHPDFDDGSMVRTGPPVRIEGREFETTSTIYRLGRVSAEYRSWMKGQDLPYNRRQPIKRLERGQNAHQ